MVLILGHLEFPIGGLIDTQDELPLVGEVLPRLLTLLVDRVQGAVDDAFVVAIKFDCSLVHNATSCRFRL